MREMLIKARGARTQTEVASELGITQKHLSKLELGKCSPSLMVALRIASFYGSTVEALFPDFVGATQGKAI